MQSREFTVGLWLPNWRSKVDDPFIESTCAHSTQRIQWLKYIRISIRPNPRERECRGLSIGAAYSSHQSSGFSRACGRTRVSPFSTLPDRIVPFAPPSGTATLPAFATRSPISPSRSTLFRTAFPPSRTPSLSQPLSPSPYATLPRLSSICRAASRHLFASVIPSANLCATRGFALSQSVFSVLASFAFRWTREKIEDAEEDLRRILEVAYFLLIWLSNLQTIFFFRKKRYEF